MRTFLTLIFITNFLICFSQNSYVYKRNAFGVLEVFQSQYGLPMGNPLYKIKKNVFGYLEVENLNTSQNPYTRRPDYSSYVTQGYNLPTKQILETLETLNKKQEYDYVNSNAFQAQNKNNNYLEKINEEVQKVQDDRNNMATTLLNFYSSNISFPVSFKNGWYNVVELYKMEGIPQRNIPAGLNYMYGVCKVADNRIVEYYQNSSNSSIKDGYVFQKIKLDLSSPVKNCKSTYKTVDGLYNSIYFLDNLLDSSIQIENPQFSFYSIYVGSNFKEYSLLIQIWRNSTITNQDMQQIGGSPYSIVLSDKNLAQSGGDCSNSLLTIAFRKPESYSDKFSLGVFRLSDFNKWIINNISYKLGECQSSILND